MRPIFLFWLGVMIFVIPADAQSASSGYSQSYAILIKGAFAGSETVTETTSESGDLLSASEHEILVSDGIEAKRMAFSTKMVLAKGTWAPISYSYQYTTGDTGDSYEVAVKNSRITRKLNRGGLASEISAPAQLNMVILDFNVYHQYDYLIRRYDAKRGGRQVFADYIPLIGNDIPIALTFVEDVNLDYGKNSLPARYYKIEFVGMWSGSLFMDKDGRLIRLLIPAQDLEVVRKDLLISSPNTDSDPSRGQ
jgi:hypothetical protein